jgi:hypothetical protein
VIDSTRQPPELFQRTFEQNKHYLSEIRLSSIQMSKTQTAMGQSLSRNSEPFTPVASYLADWHYAPGIEMHLRAPSGCGFER